MQGWVCFVFLAVSSCVQAAWDCPYHLWSQGIHLEPLQEVPVVVGDVPISQLYQRGHATLKMDATSLEDFGPGGAGTRWMDLVPDGIRIHVPYDPDGEYKFFIGEELVPGWGNPAIHEELRKNLQPRIRRMMDSVMARLAREMPDREIRSNGEIMVVKSFNGFGAGGWHMDGHEHILDSRVIGVIPFGVAPPTHAYFDGKAYTADPGSFVAIDAFTWHRGINTPGQARAIISMDVFTPLKTQ